MGVDVAQGSPIEFNVVSAVLGGASGRTVALNNITWLCLASLYLNYLATATAGTRAPLLKFQDAAGNLLATSANATGPTANANFRYMAGGNLPVYNANSNLSFPTPFPLMLPPSSSINISDTANIDPNDATIWTMVFTQ